MTEGLRKFRHLPSPLDINENFKILFGGKLDPHGFSFFTSVRISTTRKKSIIISLVSEKSRTFASEITHKYLQKL